MIDLVAWFTIAGSIGWVVSLVVRNDAQQHAAQYRRGRPLTRTKLDRGATAMSSAPGARRRAHCAERLPGNRLARDGAR